MKANKFMLVALFMGALAMVGCKDDATTNPPLIEDEGNSNEEELVTPPVAAPEAGKTTVVLYVPEDTPAGCYAVGTVNGWAADNTELMFTAVEGADSERWVACTFDYAADMEIKVCAIPSDPEVAPGWSYQWGKNVDENDPDPAITEDHVIILDGTGELVLENQGQPKLKNLVDASVIYINVKAWATTPVIKPVPCETAAFKHPFGGGDWVYREATKTAEATFELNAIYGGAGVNVATDVNGNGENWYDTPAITFEGDVVKGDSVNFKFVSEKGTVGKVTITLIEKAQGSDDPVETKDITVKAKVPAAWTETITAWVWGTGLTDHEVECVKEGDWYVVTENCANLNVIFKNGAGWNGDPNQTVDITGITENTCLQLESDGASKATFVNVDCE